MGWPHSPNCLSLLFPVAAGSWHVLSGPGGLSKIVGDPPPPTMNPACEVCGPILAALPGWQQPAEGRGPAHSLPSDSQWLGTPPCQGPCHTPNGQHCWPILQMRRPRPRGVSPRAGPGVESHASDSRVPVLSVTGPPSPRSPEVTGALRLLFPPFVPREPQTQAMRSQGILPLCSARPLSCP